MRTMNGLPEECTTQTISHCVLYVTEHTWCSKMYTALKETIHMHTHQHVCQHTHMRELLAKWSPLQVRRKIACMTCAPLCEVIHMAASVVFYMLYIRVQCNKFTVLADLC